MVTGGKSENSERFGITFLLDGLRKQYFSEITIKSYFDLLYCQFDRLQNSRLN